MDTKKLKLTTGFLDKAYAISKIMEEEGGGRGYHWFSTLLVHTDDPFVVRDIVLPKSQEISKTGGYSDGGRNGIKKLLKEMKEKTSKEYTDVGFAYDGLEGMSHMSMFYSFVDENSYYGSSIDVKKDGEGSYSILSPLEFVEIVEEGLSYDEAALRKHIKKTVKFR